MRGGGDGVRRPLLLAGPRGGCCCRGGSEEGWWWRRRRRGAALVGVGVAVIRFGGEEVVEANGAGERDVCRRERERKEWSEMHAK